MARRRSPARSQSRTPQGSGLTHEQSHVTFSAEGLQRLKHGLEQAGLDAKYFAWPPAADPNRPPYRGLRPLEADDAGIFFGRDAPVISALDHLRGLREAAPPRLLVILGASGAGKSSFLRAGLAPRLARDDRNFLALPIIRPERAALKSTTASPITRVIVQARRPRLWTLNILRSIATVGRNGNGCRPRCCYMARGAYARQPLPFALILHRNSRHHRVAIVASLLRVHACLIVD